MGEKNEDYENRFTYHPVKDGQAERYGIIRERAKDYAYLLDALDVDPKVFGSKPCVEKPTLKFSVTSSFSTDSQYRAAAEKPI